MSRPAPDARSAVAAGGRIVVIAGTSAALAEAFAARERFTPVAIVTGPDVLRAGRSARTLLGQADTCVLHTVSWSRQMHPQLFQAVLALAPAATLLVADDDSGTIWQESRVALAGRLAAAPLGLLGAGSTVVLEVGRAAVDRRRQPEPIERAAVTGPTDSWILAVWKGAMESAVGGSITHISGILDGFRQLGHRVALVTAVAPPPQVAAVADRVAIAEPLPAGARFSRDTEMLLTSRAMRRAGTTLVHSLQPALVYQRHEYLLRAGLELARQAAAPLVLEWNSSEVWTRANWLSAGPLGGLDRRAFRGTAVAFETDVLRQAALVAAVSGPAADWAIEAGAAPDRVVVVPNGVDVDEVQPGDGSGLDGERAVLGWIGSFGPWHGAEMMMRVLPTLPEGVRAVMIGEGPERRVCQELADQLGVGERVEFTGALPHGEAVARLGHCDILVSPHVPIPGKRFFGSPTKLFEYMAIGRPIVASRLEQLGEILEDGRTARLVPPGDVAALSSAILGILDAPDRGAELGQNARSAAETQHTWRVRANTILDHVGAARRTATTAADAPAEVAAERW